MMSPALFPAGLQSAVARLVGAGASPIAAIEGPSGLLPTEAPAEKPGMFGNGGGTGGGVARLLGRLFDPSRMAMARAFLEGDYAAAAQMADRNRQFAAQQAQARAQAGERQDLLNMLAKPEDLGGLGLPPALAKLATLHPESFARIYNERHRNPPAGAGGAQPETGARAPTGERIEAAYRPVEPARLPPPTLASLPPGAVALPDEGGAGHPYRDFPRHGQSWLPYTLR